MAEFRVPALFLLLLAGCSLVAGDTQLTPGVPVHGNLTQESRSDSCPQWDDIFEHVYYFPLEASSGTTTVDFHLEITSFSMACTPPESLVVYFSCNDVEPNCNQHDFQWSIEFNPNDSLPIQSDESVLLPSHSDEKQRCYFVLDLSECMAGDNDFAVYSLLVNVNSDSDGALSQKFTLAQVLEVGLPVLVAAGLLSALAAYCCMKRGCKFGGSGKGETQPLIQ